MILLNESWKLLRLIIIFSAWLRCCEILTINLCMTWERFFISEKLNHTFHISLQCIVMTWFFKAHSYAHIQYIGFLNEHISVQNKKTLNRLRNSQLNPIRSVLCSLQKIHWVFLILYTKDSLIAVYHSFHSLFYSDYDWSTWFKIKVFQIGHI